MLNKHLPYLLFSIVLPSWFGMSAGNGGILRVGLNYAEANPTGSDWYLIRMEFKNYTMKVFHTVETHPDDMIYKGSNEIYFDDYISLKNVISNPFDVFVGDNTGQVFMDITIFDIHGRTPVMVHAFNLVLTTTHGHVEIGRLENGTNFPNSRSIRFNYLKMSYSFKCARTEYVDQLCTCENNDNSIGHYKCAGNGTKVCLPGWTDPSKNCREPDVCSTGPCKSNGWCVSLAGGHYKCECKPGYWGPTCEESCASLPCKNGGTCVPDDDGYKCDCSPGYSGKECEKSGCDASSGYPCGEGIRCKLLATGDFACYCLPGYGGDDCEEIDECQSIAKNSCLNGGTCRNTKGSYACDCPDKFTGNRCQDRKSACDQVNCKTGETCLDTSDEDPICVPVDGIDCTPGICNNGGTCIEKKLHYVCICLPGFHGPTCSRTTEQADVLV